MDVIQITTGVVRSPELGKRTARSPTPVENIEEAAPPEPPAPQAKAPRPPSEPTEKQYVRVQVEAATENDPGRIAEGVYWIAHDYVNVADLAGNVIGSKPLHGDAATTIARQILKEKSGGYRRIDYPPMGIV